MHWDYVLQKREWDYVFIGWEELYEGWSGFLKLFNKKR
jgi:hypothetical protein